MDIVFCTDNNYVMPCGIAITSLLENNKGESVTIHIIGLDLEPKNKLDLENVSKHYGCKILLYDLNHDYLLNYNLPFHEKGQKYITIAAYIRLFLEDILPKDLDKVLYLDADTMVVDNLQSLWNIDISNHSLAGVIEHNAFVPDEYNRLKYSSNYSYINSGVLLINLKYWRENNISTKFIQYLDQNINDIIHHDQDILNGVLYATILLLPYKYNMHSTFYSKKFVKKGDYNSNILHESRMQPVIIHYTTRKPWHKDSFAIKINQYLYYKSLTVWRDKPLTWTDTSFSRKFKFYKRKCLKFLRLRVYKDRISA